MSDKARAIERAQKLLRLASPSSGATEAERTSAALEAAKIFAENALEVQEAEEKPKRRRPRPPPTTTPSPYSPQPYHPPPTVRYYSPYSAHDWREVLMTHACKCGACHQVIQKGDYAYYAEAQGYRCLDITCAN